MIAFDWADFIAPLSFNVLATSVALGFVVGLVSKANGSARTRRLYWMVANGLVFFVPLSVLRATEGSPIWERFLATFVLWTLFALGIYVGSWQRAA